MTSPSFIPTPQVDADGARRARSVADAAAPHVPAGAPLTTAEPGPANAVDATVWSGAAVSQLVGSQGSVAVLVGEDLVQALASSPIGDLDLGAALQPALDAAARETGAPGAAAAQSVDATDALARFGADAYAVALVDGTRVHAIVLLDLAQPAPRTSNRPGLEMLHGVMMEVTVELGRTRLPVRELLALTPGAVLELDRAAGSPVDLLVNGRLIARGEVVVVDEDFGLRVTELVPATPANR
ncbi:MAG: flagellar motor switch protein FliN [Nocardioidaceae bacterium]